MQAYEYIAIPAPRKGQSAKGVKGVPGKFANAITVLMNEMAAEGWEYQRSDTLPCEERQGLTGKAVKYHALLMFRRALEVDDTLPPDQLALPSPEEDESPEAIEDETTSEEPPETEAEPEAEAEDTDHGKEKSD